MSFMLINMSSLRLQLVYHALGPKMIVMKSPRPWSERRMNVLDNTYTMCLVLIPLGSDEELERTRPSGGLKQNHCNPESL